MPKIEGGGPTLTEEEIEGFEQTLGISIPEAYRRFLRENNGGYPVPDCFKFRGRNTGSSVQSFFSLSGRHKHDRFGQVLKIYGGRVPSGYLPVARDPGGNLLCLQLGGPGAGRVFFWDHERESSEYQAAALDNMTLVSESFEEFLDELHALGG